MIGVGNNFKIYSKMCLARCTCVLIGILMFCAEIGECVIYIVFSNLGMEKTIQILFIQEKNTKTKTENNKQSTIIC